MTCGGVASAVPSRRISKRATERAFEEYRVHRRVDHARADRGDPVVREDHDASGTERVSQRASHLSGLDELRARVEPDAALDKGKLVGAPRLVEAERVGERAERDRGGRMRVDDTPDLGAGAIQLDVQWHLAA